jgi:hypothetical protein
MDLKETRLAFADWNYLPQDRDLVILATMITRLEIP